MSQVSKQSSSGGAGSTITGNTGGSVAPLAGNWNLFGSGGITVTGNPATATLTITSSGFGTWIDQATSTTAASNRNYFATDAITLTLPAAPSQGDIIKIICETTGIVTITPAAGQFIRLSSSYTDGSFTSSSRGDCVSLVYRTVGTVWIAESFDGVWIPV